MQGHLTATERVQLRQWQKQRRDNDGYYKNKEWRAWLADTPSCQVFLPPYSPNLNLTERFWKYLRQEIINTFFYRTKGQFRTAVLAFFDRFPEFG